MMIRAILILCLAASTTQAQEVASSTPRPVVSEVVTPSAGLTPSWVGTVAAPTELDLGFLSLGTLAERRVDRGAQVTKDELLAQLDLTQFDAQVRAAQAGVTIAQAQRKTAAESADRLAELLNRGVESEQAKQSADNALAAANASVEEAQAALAQAEDARKYAQLRAPADGVVTEVYVEPGTAVTAGQAVVRLATTDGREVIIAMTDTDAGVSLNGTEFLVRLVSNPELSAPAWLRLIDPLAASATRTRTAHLRLAEDASPAFRLGALVTVTRALRQRDFITVPDTALIDGATPPAVWVISAEGRKLHRTPVTTGPRAGGRTVITEGLIEGDEVLSRGVNSVTESEVVGPRIDVGAPL